MTRRNDKRNNRRNRQRSNNPELPEFASMLFGALLGKGVDMIAKKMAENAEEETPDIHAEGISNQDVTNVNNGKASLTKCTIPTDGTAVELPIPSHLQVFISENGKPMIRKKIEGDEKPTDAGEGKPITYDDICKALFYKKNAWYLNHNHIENWVQTASNYNDSDNCTSKAQVKRLIAFNKLMNIAKFVNKGWKSKYDGEHRNWTICLEKGKYTAKYTFYHDEGGVYFQSGDAANEAIRLMGENSLNDLFNKDW